MIPDHISIPRYGDRSLADLVPSLLSALGVPGMPNRLQLEPASRVVLFLVDGFGDEQLRGHAALAPFLHARRGEPLTAGFPATTVASLTSIGTGMPPGEHGLVGYTFALPGQARAFNVLTWSLYGIGPAVDLRAIVVPEQLQPQPTLFERATAAGVSVTQLGKAFFPTSGFTRAAFRGGRHVTAEALDAVVTEAVRAVKDGPSLVYAYYAGLDAAGHVAGVDSDAWRRELAAVDRAAGQMAERLPAGSLLLATGDHGMTDLKEYQRLELDEDPALRAGVRLLAGEARARHVYTQPGAATDVLAAWRARLGERMAVWTRAEAIDLGLFGPRVRDEVRPRIGDVVAAAYGPAGIVQRAVDPAQGRFNGHHGSFTPAEQLVPFVVSR
ncbi:MAG TPA: nucleotide pyrophosphatase/phosphodiesterase family protein [Candidatus Limnocylindrales bacterium]|nr:nucleotide pyrophosphatase/phosphodiesterase family protein [Candidatus Limnocylindrales bacterium]